MDLILFRYGESDGNRSAVHQGWGDFPLTDLGREQAEKTKARLRNVNIDRVIASDSVRSRETAKVIFPTVPKDFTPLLRETNCGELAGLNSKQAMERFGTQYTSRADPFDLRPFGGEHVRDMEARIKELMNTVEANDSSACVAIVTHGGPLKAIMAYVLNTEFTSVCDHITFGNCGVSRLQRRNAQWVIQYLNSTEHLSGGRASH